MASFLLGWGVTTGAGLASYPLDTIRRRMMMTSGGTGPHYKSMFDAGSQIIAKEGVKSLFKGAGAVSSRGARLYLTSNRNSCRSLLLLSTEHPPRCCRCRCLVLVRQAPGAHVRQGLLRWFRLNVATSSSRRWQLFLLIMTALDFIPNNRLRVTASSHAVVFEFRWLPFGAVSWLLLACFNVFGRIWRERGRFSVETDENEPIESCNRGVGKRQVKSKSIPAPYNCSSRRQPLPSRPLAYNYYL